MSVIYLVLSIGLLYLHLVGVTLLGGRWLPYPIARAAGVLLVTMGFFFIEHFIGLGTINWFWPLSTLAALGIIFAHRDTLKIPDFQRAEWVFLLAFAYGLCWKMLVPDIYPSSERVTDLYFMSNYYDGETLPPPDHWYAGHRFNFYYAFQHYGAALLGRWFGWQIGFALNISFVLLMAMGLALAWDFTARFVRQRASRAVLILALALGGTGVTPLLGSLVEEQQSEAQNQAQTAAQSTERMWASARFIGSYDARINTELGLKLFPQPAEPPAPKWEPRELPLENFGYQYFLGDYHPPLGGFFLLFLMLALIGWGQYAGATETPPHPQKTALQQFLLAFTVPAMLVTNTWILPMQACLLLAWVVWRKWQKEAVIWGALIAGAGLGFVLIYPFLSGFAANTLQTPIRWVRALDHTEPLRFLLLMWPVLVLFALAATEVRRRPLVLMFVFGFAVMMALGEFVWVDDPSAGRYERTNTTMKWWGWMWSGALLSSGALALASGRLWVRSLAFLVLCGPIAYAIPTAQYLSHLPLTSFGRLEGSAWFVRDRPVAAAVNWLKQAPRGIVLENWQGDAYNNQTLYALNSGQVSLMGWPSHVSLWHSGAPEVWAKRQEIIEFYKGILPEPLNWLLRNNVRYVVWGHTERNAGNWQQVHNGLAARYDWHPFVVQSPNDRVGIWVRR